MADTEAIRMGFSDVGIDEIAFWQPVMIRRGVAVSGTISGWTTSAFHAEIAERSAESAEMPWQRAKFDWCASSGQEEFRDRPPSPLRPGLRHRHGINQISTLADRMRKFAAGFEDLEGQ